MPVNTEPIPGQSGSEGENQNGEKEYRARQYFREGQTQLEVLTTSINKDQLIDSSRTFMAGYEDMSLHRDGSVSEYRLDDAIALVGNRKADMSYPLRDLLELGYLSYDENGVAIFSYPGFSYTSTVEMDKRGQKGIYDAEGKLLRIEVEEEPTQVFLPGTDIERSTLSVNLGQVQAEMTAREDLAKMLRWVWNQTENLEDLVKFYYMGSITQEAMAALCEAEGRKNGLTMTEGGVEYRKGHEFGDAISVSLQCLEIAALSESPAELENLLKRLGAQLLFNVTDQEIDDIFLSPDKRGNRQLNDKLVKWIGQPWQWNKGVGGVKENLKNEVRAGVRGLLTRNGNVLAAADWEDAENLFKEIERFLGGGDKAPSLLKKDVRDARFIAWGLLRTTGMASELGGQMYKQECVDGKVREVVSHDLGGMTSCDRVKVYLPNVFRNVYRYIKPEIRNFGPDGSLGEYPDRLTVAYFKQWTGKNDSGAKRTFQEMRWGYRKGEEADFLTGRKVMLPAERAHRLGELPWDNLHPKAFNAAALGPYIAGRENVGLFTYVKRTNWDIKEIKDEGFAKSLANWLGIATNGQTVFDGKFRGVYSGDPAHDNVDLNKKVKNEIREYKKKFIKAWWNGLRSLPQWREWMAVETDKMDSNANPSQSNPIERIKYRLGRVEILTPDEAANLPTDFYYDLEGKGYKGF